MSNIPHDAEAECARIVAAVINARDSFASKDLKGEFVAKVHLGQRQKIALKLVRNHARGTYGIELVENTFMGLPIVFESGEDFIHVDSRKD